MQRFCTILYYLLSLIYYLKKKPTAKHLGQFPPIQCKEAIILPPGRLTECSDEWNHAGRGVDSPDISNQIGSYRAGGYYPPLQWLGKMFEYTK